jgi:hypothetical protein
MEINKDMEEEEIKEWIEDCLDDEAHGNWFRAPNFNIIQDVAELMSPRFMRKLQEQKNTIMGMIKKNTAENKYRDGETAFDIVQDINKLL